MLVYELCVEFVDGVSNVCDFVVGYWFVFVEYL